MKTFNLSPLSIEVRFESWTKAEFLELFHADRSHNLNIFRYCYEAVVDGQNQFLGGAQLLTDRKNSDCPRVASLKYGNLFKLSCVLPSNEGGSNDACCSTH